MLRQFIRYLLPPLSSRQKIPLLPREFSSNQSVWGDVPEDKLEQILYLQGHGVARTPHDGLRILMAHKGKNLNEIIRLEKRKRRREGRVKKAIRRFIKLW